MTSATERNARQRKLPSLRTPSTREIEIEGMRFIVHKPPARNTVRVLTRLAQLMSEEILGLFAHSDDDDPDNVTMAALLNWDSTTGDPARLKSLLLVQLLPVLKDRLMALESELGGLEWFIEQLLDRRVGIIVDDVEEFPELSIADLEKVGLTTYEIIQLFWAALELALFPTSGAPDTSDGSESEAPEEATKAHRKKSSGDASINKTGRSGQISRLSRSSGR